MDPVIPTIIIFYPKTKSYDFYTQVHIEMCIKQRLFSYLSKYVLFVKILDSVINMLIKFYTGC